jgi:aspartate/methionine/tyrosine aminotransferase
MTQNIGESNYNSNTNTYDIKDQYKDTRIFDVYGKYIDLGKQPGMLNFGQGFSDMDVPEFITDSLKEALGSNLNHQYSRTAGSIPLMKEAAKFYSRYFSHQIDPMNEIMVSSGATGCYYNYLEACVRPGDEIVTFEPMFAYFIPPLFNAGAKVNFVNLLNEVSGPTFDKKEFEAAFSPRTKVLMINSPHNPTGKVFSLEELQYIADFLKAKYPDVTIIADDIYCGFVYGGKKHTMIASLPDMWQRTVTLFSFGKVYNVTGWRIGFAVGPKEIISAMSTVQLYTMFCLPTPLLLSAEAIIRKSYMEPYQGKENYLEWMNDQYEQKFHRIKDILIKSSLRLDVCSAEGGFFFLSKIDKAVEGLALKYFYKDEDKCSKLQDKDAVLGKFEDWLMLEDPDFSPDFAYCNFLADKYSIIFYPLSGFYDTMYEAPKNKKCVNYIRGTIGKANTSIDALKDRLGVTD